LPALHFSHELLGGVLPIVPARHAVNPEEIESSIFEPSGTSTDEELPLVTICPFLTLVQLGCFGSD
jgi:hypothetical protein